MMVSSVTPGVVLKTNFATSNLKAYQEYVDYVDREDAKKENGAHEKLFTLYQDYLANPDKTSSLFTGESDGLNEQEKKKLKQVFETAQANKSKVIHHLETHNFRGSIFLNEQEYEWESMVTPFHIQKKYPNRRKGKEIPALALAGGFPFHFMKLDDPYGTYQGTTGTGGSVIFDLFHKDEQRKSYNAVMIGRMGAGKSTFLKKVPMDNAIKGYKIRGLDIVGEFKDLVQQLGGKQVSLDGSV